MPNTGYNKYVSDSLTEVTSLDSTAKIPVVVADGSLYGITKSVTVSNLVGAGNTLVVSSLGGDVDAFDTLQEAYDWLKSSDRDDTLGTLTSLNKRVLSLAPGTYTDDITTTTGNIIIRESVSGSVSFLGIITDTYDSDVDIENYSAGVSTFSSDQALALHLPMNDNSATAVVRDLSGNGRNGTIVDPTGTATTTAHKIAGKVHPFCLDFDGVDDWIEVPQLDWLGNNSFTKYGTEPLIDGYRNTFGSVWKDGDTYYVAYTDVSDVYMENSADGITFANKTKIIDASGSADDWDSGIAVSRIWKDGDTWFMLYRGKKGANYVADWTHAIGLASCTDSNPLTGTWTRVATPILTGTSGEWDEDGGNLDPWGLILVGTTYYLYYNADNSGLTYGTRCTGLATIPQSDLTGDGGDTTNWTKNANNPIFNYGRFCPCPFKLGSYYYLIIPAFNLGATDSLTHLTFDVYRDTSPTFYESEREYGGVVMLPGDSGEWDYSYLDTPDVLCTDITRTAFVNDPIRMYYSGRETTSDDTWRMGLATFTLENLTNLSWKASSNQDWSASMWVKHDTLAGTSALVTIGRTAFYKNAMFAFKRSTTTMVLAVGDQDVGYTSHTVGVSLSTDTWYFVVVGREGDNLYSSLDGGPKITTAITVDYVYDIPYPVFIGKNQNADSDYFDGKMDNLKLWNRALTDVEIQQELGAGY